MSSSPQPNSNQAASQVQYSPAPADATPKPVAEPVSLLDSIVETRVAPASDATRHRLSEFLQAQTFGEAARAWYGDELRRMDRRALLARLASDLAEIDRLLTDQVNQILHHPRFQQLEASWRGLHYLCNQVEPDTGVMVRALNITWKELARDLENAVEFDRSQLFQRVYDDEFGTAGGNPYGLLIGDYSIRPRPTAGHTVDDLATLQSIAGVAASAFAPFVAAADPSFFNMDSFVGLQHPDGLTKMFDTLEYQNWRAFRGTEDARFVGLTVPKILMRLPYQDDGTLSEVHRHRPGQTRPLSFQFREDVTAPDRSGYLWGNPAYAFGAVVVRAFSQTGWCADIRGVQRDVLGGGLVTGLPAHSFDTDRVGVMTKSSTDVVITDLQEKELGDLGFIPLCQCRDTIYCAFYGNQSVQKSKAFTTVSTTASAKLSSMLQYILCASRFAHYLKVIARDRIGSNVEAHEVEDILRQWLNQYVAPDPGASSEVRARFPLREARVQVRPNRQKPGVYNGTIDLMPHYQLDSVMAVVRLSTELAPPGTRN